MSEFEAKPEIICLHTSTNGSMATAGRRTGSSRAAPLALRATTVSGGQPSRARELVSSPLLQFSSLKKPFFESGEDGRKRSYGQHPSKVKRRGLDHARHSRFLYREYCRARLAEMRKQLWLPGQSREIPEAFVVSTDRDSDNRTVGQREARTH
jgi:hypothetical protein